ncbi:hypothetical protein PBY51_002737 [Eleginops maclovinus]|uniref:G-protein coupled receptors family 1 profile domain-containing protein n=1 Tax=Eleginops maclovinus TaxID=56733 RepID=A0AAN8AKN9_ELEMC|nr:hypothetical protein PBY51_002737 [Eleginops maclovinus]
MASNITTTISQQSSSSSDPLSISAQVGIAILTLAFVLGFPGNLFVVWSVLCRVKKRSVTCLLVLNLSMADAFVLLSAPLFLRYLARGQDWEFGSAACKLVHYLSSVNMYVSIYLICLMSVDRWLAVSRPFLFKTMRTKRSLLILLLGVWVWALLLSLPMPFYRRLDPKSTSPNNITLRSCVPYHWESKGHRVFQYLFETIMAFLLPYSLINTCNSTVLCRLQSTNLQHRRRSSRLILMIICTFAIFWLPYHIVNIIEVVGLLQDSKSTVEAAYLARPSVTAFAYFSSAANPIFYVLAGTSYIRQAGLGFMGKLFEATSSESRAMPTFSWCEHINCSCSEPEKSPALNTLSTKLDTSGSVEGKEVVDPELRTLASQPN